MKQPVWLMESKGPDFFLWLSWCLRPLEGVPANAAFRTGRTAPAKWTSKVGNFMWRWQWTGYTNPYSALLIGNPSNMIDHTLASSIWSARKFGQFQWSVVKFGHIHEWKTKHLRTMKNPWVLDDDLFLLGAGLFPVVPTSFREGEHMLSIIQDYGNMMTKNIWGSWNQSPSSLLFFLGGVRN